MRYFLFLLLLFLFACSGQPDANTSLDRRAIVSRHTVRLTAFDTLNALSLGNGRFAMTMDVTGLQTFPEAYRLGMSLGTLSEWGWHSFPSNQDYRIEETLAPVASHGRNVPYARQWPGDSRAGQAADYIRNNPHRIHLGQLGWYLRLENGERATIQDIQAIDQRLDLWRGELISTFEIEGVPVRVVSVVDQANDQLGVRVESELLRQGRLGLDLRFPYPTGAWLDQAATYDANEQDRLHVHRQDAQQLVIERQLDTTDYFTRLLSWDQTLSSEPTEHGFRLLPDGSDESWTFALLFTDAELEAGPPSFAGLRRAVHDAYGAFWRSGGMIDFGQVEDPRAAELERRMILSLYLTRINCGGSAPPQETGLVYNSWYGKPHMEMLWWHGVHFALWGRPGILERQLSWYFRAEAVARQIAARQGFEGVRWQKMTDPWGGETPSSTGSYLIWQQPHLIYFAELLYRIDSSRATLETYAPLIEATADFMADFAWYDPERDRHILGPGVIAAQERFDPQQTFNPTYELAYWRWALETSQQWRERLGMARNADWDEVLEGLSPLPVQNGLYLAAESAPDSYTSERLMTDHPSVLGTFGMLPATEGLDTAIMRVTFNKVWTMWQWHDTWGWDFPMTAMTAARLGMPEQAVDALLMDITTNTYLASGHNYQTPRLRLYLPGNGGLLTALAMMAAGWDGASQPNPGFPSDWTVGWEGLHAMP